MGIKDMIFGNKKEPLNKKILELRNKAVQKASEQSNQLKIVKEAEARKIAAMTGLLTKNHHPAHFVDTAMILLSYPPELAYVIALYLDDFKYQLGFNPHGTTMVAVTQIDSLYQGGMIVRWSSLKERPGLEEIINNRSIRIEKAGKFLATSIIIASETIDGARMIYHNNTFDPSVKAVLDAELKKYDEEVAKEIIK